MSEISDSFWRSLAEEMQCSVPATIEEEFRLVEKSSGGWNGLLDFILQQPMGGSTEVSGTAENQALLRYPAHLLWDSSRVVLSASDPPIFINATHVSLPQVDRHYVLTQSPLLSTMSHFWSMVWQLQIRSLLMMNLFNEKTTLDSVANQIHSYLPNGAENGDSDVKEFGDFVITYETRESFPSFDLTQLQITQKSTQQSRSISHYAFKSWTMDTEDIPLYTSRSDDLLEFVFQLYSRGVLDKVSPSQDPCPPVLLHCSDGLGRSGALLLLEYCLQIVIRTNSLKGVKIPELVHELREQRRGVITAGDQLKTVYTCLMSGAGKLLSHKSAVPKEPTADIRDSDDESVDLETQQSQDLDSSGDDFEIIQKPRYNSSDVGQDSGSGEQMSSIESSSEVSLQPFQSASLMDTPSIEPQTYPLPTEPQTYPLPTETQTYPLPTETQTYPPPTETQTYPLPTETQTYPLPTETQTFPLPTEIQTYPLPTEIQTDLLPTETQAYPLPTETQTYPLPTETQTYPLPTETQTLDNVDTSPVDTTIAQETNLTNTDSIILSEVPLIPDPLTPPEDPIPPAIESAVEISGTAAADETPELQVDEGVLTDPLVPEPTRASLLHDTFYSIAPEPTPEPEPIEIPRYIEPPPTEGVTKRLTATGDTNPPPKETTSHPSSTPVTPPLANEHSLQNMSIFLYLLLPLVFVVVVILVLLYLN